MARKSFLTDEDFEIAEKMLLPPLIAPNGDERFESHFNSSSFAFWLSLRLEDRLAKHPAWLESHPIALGSWARGELSPKSDFDLIFSGDDSQVKGLVADLHERGLNIRYRVPANPNDWTEGVEPFDILALFRARPFTAVAAQKLAEAQKSLWKNINHLRPLFLKAMEDEREQRRVRYDSMSNFLEPNLKHGPGGLRDLTQGFYVQDLFPEKLEGAAHALAVLKYYRAFFLSIRQKLHLRGMADSLVGPEQPEIAKWFGYAHHKEFMRQVQLGLSRVSFYSDWIFEQAKARPAKLKYYRELQFKEVPQVIRAFEKDTSLMMQQRVRAHLDGNLKAEKTLRNPRAVGKMLEKVVSVSTSEDLAQGVFRSRLIDRLCPEIKRLTGYVQHDQYHRYTADAHILAAIREVKRVYRKPRLLGALKPIAQKFSKFDWDVLAWSCLYHDLGKGLESKDHSIESEEFVEKDFSKFQFNSKLKDEVKWIARNHLILSQAAFRRNPMTPETWEYLASHGAEGERLKRLAIFTALDIRATNPEAWNDWKGRLIFDLVSKMESRETQSLLSLQKNLQTKKAKIDADLISGLDPMVVGSLPAKVLAEDLKVVTKAYKDEEPLALSIRIKGKKASGRTGKNAETWIRFHKREDQAGLFARYAFHLYRSGCKIQHASAQTHHKYGVYDWFQVATSRTPMQLKKILAQPLPNLGDPPAVRFETISLISQDPNEWVLSFKGLDQSGLLVAASQALFEVGARIRWARVHTWGREIDDIFSIEPLKDPDKLLTNLRSKFSL
ncbi:MAG: HD domain-containing protein [Pseudobdellovibrionaceae bacterium]